MKYFTFILWVLLTANIADDLQNNFAALHFLGVATGAVGVIILNYEKFFD